MVSSTNETDLHDIAEILLKVALNTIALTRTLLKLLYTLKKKKKDKCYTVHFYYLEYTKKV